MFYKHAASQYKDTVYEVKDKWLKKKEQDLSVLDHVFQEWRRRWEDPDYRKRCKKQSGNVAQSGLERVVACLHTLVVLALCVSTNEHWYDF